MRPATKFVAAADRRFQRFKFNNFWLADVLRDVALSISGETGMRDRTAWARSVEAAFVLFRMTGWHDGGGR